MDTSRRSQDMHVADRLVNLLSPLSLLTHALTKVAHVSKDILIEGPRTATCNPIFFFGLSKLDTCLCVDNRSEPRHVVKPFERDTLRLAFLREQRRDAGEALPETLYARERRESRRVLGRLTDK
jgi:hypothetical protein